MGYTENAQDIDRNPLLSAARGRVCELGPGDHGHTDCWIISGLLAEIERQEARYLAVKNEEREAMDTLTEAMGFEGWIDSDDGHRWPPGAEWGEHTLATAALVVRDRMWSLENQVP